MICPSPDVSDSETMALVEMIMEVPDSEAMAFVEMIMEVPTSDSEAMALVEMIMELRSRSQELRGASRGQDLRATAIATQCTK